MALINCKECGKQISDQASSCPHCGAPVAGNPPAPSATVAPLAAESVRKTSTYKYILYGTLVLLVAISCMGGGKTSNTPREFNATQAIFLCEHAIKQVSKDPEKAKVPMVSNVGSGDEYVFVWGPQTKLTRLHNGLGLEVGVPAVCKVSHAQKKMNSLSVDGKTIF